jgi:sugar lactone lactonase YvrE
VPPYRGLVFDSEGNLWVHPFMPDGAANVFDVFSPKGEFLQQIRVEGALVDRWFTGTAGLCFAGTYLWRIEHDADGFASLVKYRLTAGA